MNEYWKLTDEDVKIAEKNGIHERLARFRYEQVCWDRERAITQPVRKSEGVWTKWKEVAAQNGVKECTFYARLSNKNSKWTPELAATTPPAKPGDKIMRRKRKISEELVKRAEANGINKYTLYSRLRNYHWNEEKAVTEPVAKGRRKRNDFNKPIEKRSF